MRSIADLKQRPNLNADGREILWPCWKLAHCLGHQYVVAGHILLSLLMNEERTSHKVLTDAGIYPIKVLFYLNDNCSRLPCDRPMPPAMGKSTELILDSLAQDHPPEGKEAGIHALLGAVLNPNLMSISRIFEVHKLEIGTAAPQILAQHAKLISL